MVALQPPPHTVPVPDVVLDEDAPSNTDQLGLVKTARVQVEQHLGQEVVQLAGKELADHLLCHHIVNHHAHRSAVWTKMFVVPDDQVISAGNC